MINKSTGESRKQEEKQKHEALFGNAEMDARRGMGNEFWQQGDN